MTPRLPKLVQTLLDTKIYPDKPERVELMQTQMSFVFLTGDYVYKIKKPVTLGYLDYRTLGKRHFYCQREVELNQRLCPEIYLGVVPIVRTEKNIALGGKGKIIEYAVKMCQLPREKMLSVLLANDKVSPEMLARVAQKLADFHKKAETNYTISTFGSFITVRVNADENFRQTEKYIGLTISPEKYRRINDHTSRFIERNTMLFQKRIAGGKIRDCHGDLHAAHICVTNGICIYDCIEFNDRFRYCDVASEVAFLAMDLDHYGRADLSRSFVDAYVTSSHDNGLMPLLSFYKCYRAYVRGKAESFKLDDRYIDETEKRQIMEVAASYFDLAGFYIRPKPVLFITVGLMGTGKTVLAQALAKRLRLIIISSDVTRKRLADIPPTEHRFAKFGAGIYSEEFSRLTYDTMFAEARRYLSEGSSVILDASFIKAEERQKAQNMAQETNADYFVLECSLDEDQIRQRLTRRLVEGTVSDGRWEIFESQKKSFDPVVEIPTKNHVIMDASKPVSENIKQVLGTIEE
ncbi:MAG: AAA family ATPase [Dehalococcoidales bacterium]|nr:AAA family ATPase [Dehalococcoidales bacterium]